MSKEASSTFEPKIDDEEKVATDCTKPKTVLSGIHRYTWLFGEKFCTKDHDDCVYSCEPEYKFLNQSTYTIRVVKKDGKIASQIRTESRLAAQLRWHWVKNTFNKEDFEMLPVAASFSLFDICEDKNYFYFVNDVKSDGCFRCIGENNISQADAKQIIVTLLQTVSIMHLFNITHLQLNEKSVLLSRNLAKKEWCKIQVKNYGLGSMISKMASTSDCHDKNDKDDKDAAPCDYAISPFKQNDCNDIFVAPEVFDSNYKILRASDVWSLGMLIFRLVYGKLPGDDLIELITQNGIIDKNKIQSLFPKCNVKNEPVHQNG